MCRAPRIALPAHYHAILSKQFLKTLLETDRFHNLSQTGFGLIAPCPSFLRTLEPN
jgi:hypothetical protein